MDVEPFCACPGCKKFGLHYMARTHVGETPRFMEVCKIREVPRVQWYDKREELPQTQLKYGRYIATVMEVVWSVVRECFYCSREWNQMWKVTKVESEDAEW